MYLLYVYLSEDGKNGKLKHVLIKQRATICYSAFMSGNSLLYDFHLYASDNSTLNEWNFSKIKPK